MALAKWIDWSQVGDTKLIRFSNRVDSQDSWIFRSPLDACVSQNIHVDMGEVGCDNIVAGAFKKCGYTVQNPALFIRSVEYSTRERITSIYSRRGGGMTGGAFVLLDDAKPFQH